MEMPASAGGHVKVTYRRAPNFLERIGSSFVGSLIGLGVVLGGCSLLYWNEGRAVATYSMLLEARRDCHQLQSPDHAYDSLSGKLVYVTGSLAAPEPLYDHDYGVSKFSARLRRKVEMYQWVEETRKREYEEADGTIRRETEYSYTTAWRSQLVNSRGFDDRRYDNPSAMPVDSVDKVATVVNIGAFTLSRDALLKVENWRRVMLAPSNTTGVHNNMFYHGDPFSPKVGDVRVWFEYAGSTELGQADKVSVVGRQSPGGVLGVYTTESGHTVLLLYTEDLTMEEVFTREHSFNNMLTWVLRGVGWLVIFIGCNMVSQIVVTLFDWLPIVRELLALSTLILSAAVSFLLASVIIAIAWLRYRPLMGLVAVGIGLMPFIVPRVFGKPKNQ